ncbi:zinc-dependent alcohol dehydrogenase family protein [Maritalea sp.]|jgi:NADPH:quinone reductase-like Zn-dependent oxidoreductase|uniref:zinc-dependent alcohol dehydrogenase family protein n=1 Tax=Maritalea sp. TaxID=2003361 RepID=UPI0039E329F7
MLKAIYEETGSPLDVLKLVDTDIAELNAGDVRVDVLATPIHNADLLQMQGQYGISPQFPATPGSEGVGRIVEIGAGISHLEVGQTVLITGTSTWAKQIVAPAQNLIPMPEGVDADQISMLVVNPASALLMLNDYVDLQAGDWIIQNSSNSAVGSLVIQLAKLRGIKTVNIVRRAEVVGDLEALGADVVLVDGPELEKQVAAATNGEPIRLGLDSIGGASFAKLVSMLAPSAKMVVYSSMDGAPVSVPPMDMIFKGISFHGFWLAQWFKTATQEDMQKLFGELVGHVANGNIHMKIDSAFPLTQLEQAVARAMETGRNGKVILRPQS